MFSSRPVLPQHARFRASAARVYTHLASPPWLVGLIPLWANLGRNNSFSVSRLSEIPQTSVTKIVSRTAVDPAPARLYPTAVGPAPYGALPYSSAALGAAGLRPAIVQLDLDQHAPHGVPQKRRASPYHLLNSDSQLFHLRSFELHVLLVVCR